MRFHWSWKLTQITSPAGQTTPRYLLSSFSCIHNSPTFGRGRESQAGLQIHSCPSTTSTPLLRLSRICMWTKTKPKFGEICELEEVKRDYNQNRMFLLSFAILQTTNSQAARGGAVLRAGVLCREKNLPVRGKQGNSSRIPAPDSSWEILELTVIAPVLVGAKGAVSSALASGAHGNGVTDRELCHSLEWCHPSGMVSPICPAQSSWHQSLVTSHPLGTGKSGLCKFRSFLRFWVVPGVAKPPGCALEVEGNPVQVTTQAHNLAWGGIKPLWDRILQILPIFTSERALCVSNKTNLNHLALCGMQKFTFRNKLLIDN